MWEHISSCYGLVTRKVLDKITRTVLDKPNMAMCAIWRPETRIIAVHGDEKNFNTSQVTQILHEIGHILGLDDIDEKNENDACRVKDQ